MRSVPSAVADGSDRVTTHPLPRGGTDFVQAWSPLLSTQTETLRQFHKPCFRTQILQHRIDFYKRQPVESLLPRLLEPVERKLALIEPGIDHRRLKRRNILLLREFLQPRDHLLRFDSSSCKRLRVAQRSQRCNIVRREFQRLLECRNRFFQLSFLFEHKPQFVISTREILVHLEQLLCFLVCFLKSSCVV